jgi:peptide chain release factor 3
VTQHRLRSEYGASVVFEPLPYRHARWIEGDAPLDKLDRPGSSACVLDVEGRPLVLFESEWLMHRAAQDHPGVRFVQAVQPARAGRPGVRSPG